METKPFTGQKKPRGNQLRSQATLGEKKKQTLPSPSSVPDDEEWVFPDFAGHVKKGIGTRRGKNGAWEQSCLRRTACLLLLHLLKNILVDGAPQQVLIAVHHPARTLIHPVQFFLFFPGSRQKNTIKGNVNSYRPTHTTEHEGQRTPAGRSRTRSPGASQGYILCSMWRTGRPGAGRHGAHHSVDRLFPHA